MKQPIVTRHVVQRFLEANPGGTDDIARMEIRALFASAKEKHKRAAARKGKSTTIVPTANGFLIASHGRLVTYVKELRKKDSIANK